MSNRLIDSIQIITSLAVVAGLGLVVYELRQSHSLARAEAAGQTRAVQSAEYTQMLGENFSETLAKACREPDALTPSEQIQMYAYVSLQLNTIARMIDNAEIANFGYDWRETIKGPLSRILATRTGRARYEIHSASFSEEYRTEFKKIAISLENINCENFYF